MATKKAKKQTNRQFMAEMRRREVDLMRRQEAVQRMIRPWLRDAKVLIVEVRILRK